VTAPYLVFGKFHPLDRITHVPLAREGVLAVCLRIAIAVAGFLEVTLRGGIHDELHQALFRGAPAAGEKYERSEP
jgi:hypothetical protein